jgi:tripartite motif-containing protein 2/3/tripartite motif-containing protein 71
VQSKFGSQGSGDNQFNWPHSIAITPDPMNRVAFIADTNNHRIVSYNVATRTQVGAYGSSSGNELRLPAAVALSPVTGNLFVADTNHNRIVELNVTADGTSFTLVETYTGEGGFKRPQGVAVAPGGRIYVADTGHDRMVVLRPTGTVLGTVTGLDGPEAVSVDPATGLVYLSDTHADRVRVYAYPS